jgi:cold shock CspA family protein
MTGTVKWFTDIKGFIIPDGCARREDEVFVHVKDLHASRPRLNELRADDRVSFDTADPLPGKPCRRAINIKLLLLFLAFSIEHSALGAGALYGYIQGPTNMPVGQAVQLTCPSASSLYPYFLPGGSITVYTQTNGYFVASNLAPGNYILSPGQGHVAVTMPNDNGYHNFLDCLTLSNALTFINPSSYYLAALTNATNSVYSWASGSFIANGSSINTSAITVQAGEGDIGLTIIGDGSEDELLISNPNNESFINIDEYCDLAVSGGWFAVGPGGFIQDEGSLTVSTGFASYATNRYSFASGGFTNSGTNTIRVWGFTGTNFMFSNSASTVHFRLGTVTNAFFTLNPNESLQGTNCTVAGAVDF